MAPKAGKKSSMAKILLAVVGVFVVLGSFSVMEFRNKMSAARLGSDVTYSLDAQGNAAVEMVNKSYFTDADVQKNFDNMVARIGQPDIEAFRKGVEDSLKNVSDKTGRQFSVSDFEGSFQRQADYGGQAYRFRWSGFAEQRDGSWVVDFKAANVVKLNKDSSLTVVLPPGAVLVKADPAPTGGNGTRLVWTGTGEMPWPYIEYRR